MTTKGEKLDNTPAEVKDTVMFTTDSNWILFGRVVKTEGKTPKSHLDVELTSHGLEPSKSIIRREDAVVVIKSRE